MARTCEAGFGGGRRYGVAFVQRANSPQPIFISAGAPSRATTRPYLPAAARIGAVWCRRRLRRRPRRPHGRHSPTPASPSAARSSACSPEGEYWTKLAHLGLTRRGRCAHQLLRRQLQGASLKPPEVLLRASRLTGQWCEGAL